MNNWVCQQNFCDCWMVLVTVYVATVGSPKGGNLWCALNINVFLLIDVHSTHRISKSHRKIQSSKSYFCLTIFFKIITSYYLENVFIWLRHTNCFVMKNVHVCMSLFAKHRNKSLHSWFFKKGIKIWLYLKRLLRFIRYNSVNWTSYNINVIWNLIFILLNLGKSLI